MLHPKLAAALALLLVTFLAPAGAAQSLLGLRRRAGPPEDVRGMVFLVEAGGGGMVMGPFPTIQAAVDAASDGDTVLLTEGVFLGPGNRDVLVTGKDLVIRGEEGPAGTVVDCRGKGRAFTFDGPDVGSETLLEGVTIRNGVASLAIGTSGGAVLVGSESAPTIENCVFRDCDAGFQGGAVAYTQMAATGTSRTLRGCLFVGNGTTDTWNGGAVLAADVLVDRCTFLGNLADGGGAIGLVEDVFVRDSLFVGNSASGGGGALVDTGSLSSLARVVGCTFVGNSALQGGAISFGTASISLTVITTVANSIFWGNTANLGSAISYIPRTADHRIIVRYCIVEGGASALDAFPFPGVPPPTTRSSASSTRTRSSSIRPPGTTTWARARRPSTRGPRSSCPT